MDPNAGGRVQSAHGGRIETGPKGLPVLGQTVKQGDVLAYVRHHAEPYALATQQAQLAELRAQRQLAEQRVKRLEGLEGTVPRKEIEAARAEAISLAERERSIGASLVAREALTAPINGVIARADIALGQVVEPRDVLFEVVDPTRMLVEATIADAAAAARVADASVQGIPEVTLPAQAVVRNPSNEPIVWIKSGAERFIPQPVQLRPLDANTVVITQGLSADNRVVVQGAPLIAQIR